MEWSNLIGPILGVIGIPLGLLLGEYLGRRQRVEQFAVSIFTKRLEAYEILLGLLNDGSRIAEEVINNHELSTESRHDLISTAIFPIVQHFDRSVLYIDEELGVHCSALFMGVEDIGDLPESAREEQITNYRKNKRETQRMIFEDSGVAEVNKLFRAINHPIITSPIIERMRELRRKQTNLA